MNAPLEIRQMQAAIVGEISGAETPIAIGYF
jgi:hypothetical protein